MCGVSHCTVAGTFVSSHFGCLPFGNARVFRGVISIFSMTAFVAAAAASAAATMAAAAAADVPNANAATTFIAHHERRSAD